jgi:hypothetical protein
MGGGRRREPSHGQWPLVRRDRTATSTRRRPQPSPSRHCQGRAAPGGAQCVVALATPAFSRHLAPRSADGSLPPQTPELLAALAPALVDALKEVVEAVGIELPRPAFVQAHRWGLQKGAAQEWQGRGAGSGALNLAALVLDIFIWEAFQGSRLFMTLNACAYALPLLGGAVPSPPGPCQALACARMAHESRRAGTSVASAA